MSAAAVQPRRVAPRVPSELLDLAQWCLWGLHEGRKRPMALEGYWGSSTNPATWGEYAEAIEALENVRNAEGIGFVFTADDPYTGVDLDDCLDNAGRLKPWAVDILRRFAGTYAEVSPSGSGIKLWCRGTTTAAAKFAYHDGAIEIYSTARFFTVTGNLWPGSLLEIADCQESLDWLLTLNPAGAKKGPFVLPEKINHPTQHKDLLSLAGSYRSKGMNQAEIEAALIAVSKARCEEIPPESHMRTMAASVCKYPPGPSLELAQQVDRPTNFGWHDTGNADRLVCRHGSELLWCEERKSFGVWTGQYWKLGSDLLVKRMAERVMRDAYAEVGSIDDTDKRKEFLRFLNKSLSRSGVANMVEVAQRKVDLVSPGDFDADPFLLNFENGTLDLRSGLLREHRPADKITRCIPYAFDWNAPCSRFHRFLGRIMGDHPAATPQECERAYRIIGYLQRLFGCALTGKPEKILAILHGSGNNGKSTLIETIRAALGGKQYAGQMQIESLMVNPAQASGSNAINADLADLQGCRFVTASEPEKGMRFSVARIKYLTGLTEVKARYLKENPFTFKPSHKVFVDANDRPIINDPHDAVWNRVKLIPFEVKIPDSEIDTGLGDALLKELPGIMAWLAEGAREYIRHGLQEIPEVSAATEEYRQESDRLKDFIEDHCIVLPTAWVGVSNLWDAYRKWEEENGVKFPLVKTAFDERIQRLGCTKKVKECGTIRAWQGIGLKASGVTK